MRIVVSKTLEPWWGRAEDFAEMTDAEIIELVLEDVGAFVHGAEWEIEREDAELQICAECSGYEEEE